VFNNDEPSMTVTVSTVTPQKMTTTITTHDRTAKEFDGFCRIDRTSKTEMTQGHITTTTTVSPRSILVALNSRYNRDRNRSRSRSRSPEEEEQQQQQQL
jgi:hypothetical protein